MLFLGEDVNAFALVEFFGFFSPTYFPSLYKDKGGSELQARHWQAFFITNFITSTFSNRKKKINNIKFNMSLNPISRKQNEITQMPVELVFCIIHNSFSIFLIVVDQTLKKSACNAGDLGSIPGLGRSPGEGNGNPLQYSSLENPMDRRAWWATVHGVAESDMPD